MPSRGAIFGAVRLRTWLRNRNKTAESRFAAISISLGLVLAEMFTGQKASDDRKLSTTVRDIDPAVEKVIQRCLDPNSRNRPATALDLARALPGGDPLAEALAAGRPTDEVHLLQQP